MDQSVSLVAVDGDQEHGCCAFGQGATPSGEAVPLICSSARKLPTKCWTKVRRSVIPGSSWKGRGQGPQSGLSR